MKSNVKTYEQLAKQYGVSTAHISKVLSKSKGKIQAVRYGKMMLVDLDSFDEFYSKMQRSKKKNTRKSISRPSETIFNTRRCADLLEAIAEKLGIKVPQINNGKAEDLKEIQEDFVDELEEEVVS